MFNNCSIQESNMAEEKKFEGIQQLAAQIATISDDIDDHIDENPIEDICGSIEDLDAIMMKTENIRTQYRSKHQEMRISLGNQYKETYEASYEEKLALIKEYIKEAKDARKNMGHQESSKKEVQKQKQSRSLDFSLKFVVDMMDNLKIEFAKSFENISGDEVSRRNKEQPKQLNEFEEVIRIVKEILESATVCPTKEREIQGIITRYEELTTLKGDYMERLKNEISEREINKHQLMKEKILNIKLAKFNGLNSSRDYYIFKDEFEKLHLQTTAKTMLPELLRNSYLEDPALSLVKNIQNIDEIWKRLKKAYGDNKIILSKRLTELENLEPIWKIKSPAKIAESLAKIISTIKDLMELSHRHDIELKLYNSDALDKIYK